MMPWNELLRNLQAEITVAEGRASAHTKEVSVLVASGADSTEAESRLFRELDGLRLLREQLRAVQAMKQQAFQGQAVA